MNSMQIDALERANDLLQQLCESKRPTIGKGPEAVMVFSKRDCKKITVAANNVEIVLMAEKDADYLPLGDDISDGEYTEVSQ